MKRKMTPEQLANLRPAKKGEVRNPLGANAHNAIDKALRKLTIDSFKEAIESVLSGNVEQLKDMAQSKTLPTVQVAIAMAMLTAIKKGDYQVVERIAERIIGKIPDELHVKSITLTEKINSIDKDKLAQAMKALEAKY